MIYDAEMQWLEAKQGAKDCAFVSTTFDLENKETEKTVEFEQAFPKGSELQVIGWIQSFRFGTEEGKDYACDFWATKVTPKGFTAHAECGENTERLTVTYIALKKGKDRSRLEVSTLATMVRKERTPKRSRERWNSKRAPSKKRLQY
jgi:hypothetical protein